MSFNLDDANVGGQIKVGTGIFPAIGEGPLKVNGSAGMEGPIVMGNPTTFFLILSNQILYHYHQVNWRLDLV